MALIWTKLAEEAESIQRTKLGIANDDTAGQTQVPPADGSAGYALDRAERRRARQARYEQMARLARRARDQRPAARRIARMIEEVGMTGGEEMPSGIA